MPYSQRLLRLAGFPNPEILGPDARESEIKDIITQHGEVFIKPVFKGGVAARTRCGW